MYTSRLLRLIRKFDKPKLNRLMKFLNSPYFWKKKPSPETFLLMEHIASYFPEYNSENLSKENTYALLYPDLPYIDGKLDRVMSNLLIIINDFISYEFSDLKEDKNRRKLTLARFYRRHRMEKSFHRTISAIKESQDEAIKNKDFYLKQFFVEQEVFDFESFFNTRKNDYNVLDTIRSLDTFYLVHKLEYICWLLAQGQNIPLNVNDNMLVLNQIIISLKEEKDLEEIPLIKVYDHGIRLIQSKEGADEVYWELKQLLEQYAKEIPLVQLKQLQALCRNYCTLEYNKGRESFLEELFFLYRNHLEQGYLFHEGGLLPGTMRNIVVAGLRSKEYDWVYQFLEKYKDRIVATNQAWEIYRFNLATYFFAVKKYSEALDCLADRYEDSYYLIAAKRMELKIYYELDSEILESKMAAFKIYIYRVSQKILPQTYKDGNNNFIDLLKQIRSYRTLNNPGRIEKLRLKIQNKKLVIEKEWLLEKLEECASA